MDYKTTQLFKSVKNFTPTVINCDGSGYTTIPTLALQGKNFP